jgi:hypothetical protein
MKQGIGSKATIGRVGGKKTKIEKGGRGPPKIWLKFLTFKIFF